MKRSVFILLFSLFVLPVSAQSSIITLNEGLDTLKCQIVNLYQDSLTVEMTTSGILTRRAVSDIYKVDFYENHDEVLIPKFYFDTIRGSITYIDKTYVHYDIPGKDFTQKIAKLKVFACLFNHSPCKDRLKEYAGKIGAGTLIEEEASWSLIKSDGEEVEGKLNNLDREKLYVTVEQNNQPVDLFLNKGQMQSVIFNSYEIDVKRRHRSDYILQQGGQLKEVEVKEFSGEKVFVEMDNQYGDLVRTFYETEDFCALLFYNYEGALKNELIDIRNKDKSIWGLNVYLGGGYILGRIEDDVAADIEKLNNALRIGFVHGVNINSFMTLNSGIGLSYKHFKSSGTVKDVDNYNIGGISVGGIDTEMSMVFYGLNYIYRFYANREPFYELVVAGGALTYNEETSFDFNGVFGSAKGQLEGVTPALSICHRIIMHNNEHISIYLVSETIIGVLDLNKSEFTLANTPQELEGKSNLSRFDIGIGFKLH